MLDFRKEAETFFQLVTNMQKMMFKQMLMDQNFSQILHSPRIFIRTRTESGKTEITQLLETRLHFSPKKTQKSVYPRKHRIIMMRQVSVCEVTQWLEQLANNLLTELLMERECGLRSATGYVFHGQTSNDYSYHSRMCGLV